MIDEVDWIDNGGSLDLMVEEVGGLPVLRVEESLVLELRSIEKLMCELADSKGFLFSSYTHQLYGVKVKAERLGRYFVDKLKRGKGMLEQYFPCHVVNPYVEFFFRCVDRVDELHSLRVWRDLRNGAAEAFLVRMNDLVEFVRLELASDAFKAVLKRFRKASVKRVNSLEGYIDALFAKHSRMLVVRVDLSYQSGFVSGREDFYGDVNKVKVHWAKMQKDLHKGIPVYGLLGFACKLEYGQLKGFHFHLLLFYNGSNHRQDGVLARMVGEYWRDSITAGTGRYFNCNAVKDKYKYLGIGMISFNQLDRVSALKNRVASYLTKVDYWVRLSADSGRSFFRGNMPKLKTMKRGRPRRSCPAQAAPNGSV
ncbi:inovirus Gp2 family protein [Pseudomonas sp. WS 5532]|uniref:YagK/YfjJ domain-containing protein n=1 Tax=unclassified Pseudomonas TaxID=196821 RepID=UPI0014749817|nr:inovirus Gp2 family protein [Pseudomonas sp. WS 5532]